MSYNNIQEAQLLRLNIADQIAVLNELGFNEVSSNTPLSVIAEYMRWAGGLRDLRLAVINKYSGVYSDYSEDEWAALSASAKAAFIKLGIRIRAERQDFIISKDNVTRSNGSIEIPWCESYVDVKGLANYGSGASGHLLDMDGKANTDLILAHGKANGITFEAAERARAYKASTIADGGFDDPTEWSLPSVGQLWLIYKYRAKIDAAITTFLGSSCNFINSWYWSSTEFAASYAWNVYMNYGIVYINNKTSAGRVRAVAQVPVGSGSAAI